MAQSKEQVLVAKLLADVSAFQRGMASAQTTAEKTGKKLSKTFDQVGKAIKIGLAAGMAYLAYDAMRTVKDFDQAVANLAAVTGQTRTEVARLNNNALELGASTAFTAKQVTELQTELAKLGFREQDILNLTKPILNLAQATGTDLANAASLAGSVVQSFGLDARETVKVVDIMTKSFTASALDIQKFEVGIRQVAPVAKNANVELSEVTAMLGILANNGVRAETAGVGLRNILLEAAKRGVSFKELLEDVNSAADKSARAMELFGKENAAVGVILSETALQADELNTALQDSAGTAQKMADEQLNTLSGQIKLLQSAWDGFILSLEKGDGIIAKAVNKTIGTLIRSLETLTNLSEYLEVVNPFKSMADYSDRAKELILTIGRSAESGEQYSKVLANLNAEAQSMDLDTLAANIGNIRKEFEALLRAQGDDTETITELWKVYSKNLLDNAEIVRGVKQEHEVLDPVIEDTKDTIEEITERTKDYTAATLDAKKANNELGDSLQKIGEHDWTKDWLSDKNLEKMQATQTVAMGLESAFNSMGNAMIDSLGLAEHGLQGFAKVMLQTVSQIISAVIAQSVATAIVNAMQSSQATGPAALFAQPAFIATALAGVGAALATIPKFADGGIVSGSSRYGDKVLARVNSGEMILNSGQQSNLFDMINGGGGGYIATTKIQGNDLLLAVERASNTRKRQRGF